MVVKYAVIDEKRVEVCCNGVLCIQQLPLRFLLLQNEEFAFYYLYHYYFNCRCITQTVLTALSFVIIIIGSITPQDARSIIDFINAALTLYLVITAVGRSLDQQCSIIFRSTGLVSVHASCFQHNELSPVVLPLSSVVYKQGYSLVKFTCIQLKFFFITE